MASKKVNRATFSYGGQEISMTKSKTQAAVQYVPARKTAAKRSTRSALAPPPELEGFQMVQSRRGIDDKLDELRAREDVAVGTHVWTVDGDESVPFIPTGKLYIEFTPETDDALEQDILDDLHLSVLERVAPGAYRVSITPESPNPIKCAMTLQENRHVKVAEPEFVTTPTTNDFAPPTGRYVATQWHLENTGVQIPIIDVPNAVFGAFHFRRGADAKVKEAWNLLQTLGSRYLKIAVIDTGFDLDHPQLRGDGTKIRNPFNAAKRSADVSPWFQASDGSWGVFSHGTSCAAVALGAWDTTGVLGAAPNARFIPIKLDILSDDAIKNAFEHALLNGADIISCSLGFPKPVPLSTYVTNYLHKVAREGRGGKGLPMFFAAGNANPASNFQPRQISDFGAHPAGICITASNSKDERSDYSFYGANAHNCAPTNGNDGVGITTATVDSDGNGRLVHTYTSGFGGTSSAAPLAAGVCALMLTANPNLTLSEIKSIFRQSADKIGGSAYNASGHSPYYGYGRINAGKAVRMAQQLGGASGGSTTTTTTTTTTPTSTTPTTTQPTGGTGTTSTGLKGRVQSKFLNVRSGPSTANAKVAELKQGAIVNLLERLSGWWRIGTNQYVSSDYIQIVAPEKRGKVISANLNVRTGPSVSNTKVAELKLGNIITIYETSTDGWHRIGEGKWVLGKYVQII